MKLREGIEYNDLKGLISNQLNIDKYKPKIGNEEDTVVVAISVTYEAPAIALSNFIESSDVDHLDVDISDGPNEDGSYFVFVEFLRDYHLYAKIKSMTAAINSIVDKDQTNWKYIAFKMNAITDFNKSNFNRDVISSAVRYRMEVLSK